MKHLAATIIAAVLLSGCGQPKYQTVTLGWWPGYTNLELSILANHVQTTTNVDSLDQAANILGQYGWQLVTVTEEENSRVIYLKRQYRGSDDFTVALTPPYSSGTN